MTDAKTEALAAEAGRIEEDNRALRDQLLADRAALRGLPRLTDQALSDLKLAYGGPSEMDETVSMLLEWYEKSLAARDRADRASPREIVRWAARAILDEYGAPASNSRMPRESISKTWGNARGKRGTEAVFAFLGALARRPGGEGRT